MLLISLIMLFAGPVIFLWISKGGRLALAIDRLMVVALILLVILLLVPEIVQTLGWMAIALVTLGYILPGALELLVRRAAASLHLASLILALLGLLLHAMIDGAGLAGSELLANGGLAVAIVMHRFGIGMMIWLIVQPAFGQRAAWAMLVGMSMATIVGFEFSGRLLPLAGDFAISVLQAIIIGTIIHSLVHRGHVHTHHESESDQ